jgi:hypothetical protein
MYLCRHIYLDTYVAHTDWSFSSTWIHTYTSHPHGYIHIHLTKAWYQMRTCQITHEYGYHTDIHAHMHTCTHAHMHTCTHAHMHTHTHTHHTTKLTQQQRQPCTPSVCVHTHAYMNTCRHKTQNNDAAATPALVPYTHISTCVPIHAYMNTCIHNIQVQQVPRQRQPQSWQTLPGSAQGIRNQYVCICMYVYIYVRVRMYVSDLPAPHGDSACV